MCNYNFRNLNPNSQRYTPTKHTKKNPPKISFKPSHIKAYIRKNLLGKILALGRIQTYDLQIRNLLHYSLCYESDKIFA